MSGLQSPSVKSEEEFRPEDLDCLSSPNAKRNGYDSIDYDNFEGILYPQWLNSVNRTLTYLP